MNNYSNIQVINIKKENDYEENKVYSSPVVRDIGIQWLR